MKVAIFTDSFPPSKGGTENAVMRYATALAKNHEVAVFAPKNIKKMDTTNLPFKVYRSLSIKVTTNDYWAMPKISCKMKRQLKEFAPDIIHTQTLGMMADYANAYGRKNGIPVVCTAHTKYRYCYQTYLKIPFIVNMIIKRIIKRAQKADYVCAVSNSMADELFSYGLKDKEVFVIKNGHNRREVLPERIYNLDEPFHMIYAGLIVDFKNVATSLKALKILKEKRSDFLFYMIGNGPHYNKFKRMVKKFGLSDNVKMLHYISDRDLLDEYYLKSDLMLFPSVFDTDGLVLLEAAELGTPALVIKGSGASERFTDNYTAFTEENDPEKLANRIDELMNNRTLVKEVGQRADSCFTSWDETAKNYEKLYADILDKKFS